MIRNAFALPQEKLVTTRLNKGIITSIDSADIDDGALLDAKNMRVRFDRTSRRYGNTLVPSSGGVASAIQAIFQYKKDSGLSYLVVIYSNGTVRYENGGVWTTATGTTGGGANTRYQATTIKNRFVIATDATTKLKELDVAANTIADLSANAPQARFITGFFNRVVSANISTASPIQITWSADGVITQFDPTVDETAGTGPLSDSPSDLGDPVMGLFGMDNVLFVPREYSLWLATKQPIPTNPFNFYSAVNGIGTNAPYSIARVLKGAVFADTKTGTVWYYQMGATPEPIGRLVEKDVFRNLSTPGQIVGSFNPTTNEYSLLVPSSTVGFSRIWVYNFLTKAWSYDEIANANAIADFQYAYSSTSFDQLQGTFDAQVGIFDTWGASTGYTIASRLVGLSGGTIIQEDPNTTTDNAVVYTNTVVSKDFTFPQIDIYATEIRFEYLASKDTTLTLSYSRDGGLTWKVGKIFILVVGRIGICRFQKNIKSRRLRWKLEGTTGLFDILSYEVYVSPSGISPQK